jgi:hypothetical protein
MGQKKVDEMKREKIETVKEMEGRLKGYSHEMDCRDSAMEEVCATTRRKGRRSARKNEE